MSYERIVLVGQNTEGMSNSNLVWRHQSRLEGAGPRTMQLLMNRSQSKYTPHYILIWIRFNVQSTFKLCANERPRYVIFVLLAENTRPASLDTPPAQMCSQPFSSSGRLKIVVSEQNKLPLWWQGLLRCKSSFLLNIIVVINTCMRLTALSITVNVYASLNCTIHFVHPAAQV